MHQSCSSEELENNIQECEQMRQDSIRSRDKLIVTLSSGALALSLTIYEKIFNGICPQLLIITWVCYFISLLSILFSFFTAQILFDENIKCLTALKNKEQYEDKRFVRFNTLTIIFNCVSIFSFIVASICFIIFASFNLLEKEKNMSSKIAQDGLTTNSTVQKILAEGLTPNQTNITQIKNGLTPNSISQIVVKGNSSSQQSGTQNSSNESNK